ncbi:MAG: hypothetical protein MUQ10_10925 [Anaerolineae bacterium]|nr:hypothetical protein [Anaerolineae bacterium]
MKKHVTVIGVLHIGRSVVQLLVGFIVMVTLVGSGIISQDRVAVPILTGMGLLVGFTLFIVAVPGLVGGIFLLRYKQWARILVMVVSVMGLTSIPIGTAIGVYTIWALMQDETERMCCGDRGVDSQAPGEALQSKIDHVGFDLET